jgi:hypothetical protein
VGERGQRAWGEVAQTMCTQMNKCKRYKKREKAFRRNKCVLEFSSSE